MQNVNRHISLTSFYRDEIQTFLDESGFTGDLSESLLTRLVSSLIEYRIESIAYYPTVYLFTDLAAVRTLLDDHELIHLGRGRNDVDTVDNLLLQCSPLATDRWKVFIHLRGDTFDYGLFHPLSLPVGREPRHILVRREQDRCAVAKVARIANRCVELESNRAMTRRFFFTAQSDITHSPYEQVNRIAAEIARHVPDEHCGLVREYLFRNIKHALLGSHGSLIAVLDRDTETLPANFTDYVPFTPPVDLVERIVQFEQRESRRDFLAFSGLYDLLHGALVSDGIVVFRNDGKLLAYRAFCALDNAKRGVTGGARKRAYGTLTRLVEEELGFMGAFIHSQDGGMDAICVE